LGDEQLGEKNRASGDSTDIGGPAVANNSDRLSVRDMADALMEIYIASEREREDRDKPTSPWSDCSDARCDSYAFCPNTKLMPTDVSSTFIYEN